MTDTQPRQYRTTNEVLGTAARAILRKFGTLVNPYDAARLDQKLLYSFTLRVKAPDDSDMNINVNYDFRSTRTVFDDPTGDIVHYSETGPTIQMSYQYGQVQASQAIPYMAFYLDTARFLADLETSLSGPALIDIETNRDAIENRLRQYLKGLVRKKTDFRLPLLIGPDGPGTYRVQVSNVTWQCQVDQDGGVVAQQVREPA